MPKSSKLGQVRNIAVFFKNVDERQLQDPGPQLKQVLAHKKKMVEGRRYLFKSYDQADAFCDELRKHLAAWLRDHEKCASGPAIEWAATEGPDVATFSVGVAPDLATPAGPTITSIYASPAPPEAQPPGFRYWINEGNQLLDATAVETTAISDAFFCARQALAASTCDLERAEAKYLLGSCQARLNQPADAIAIFSEVATELDSASGTDRQAWQAKALISKAVTLGRQLGRSEDAIAVYDELIARFGAASELALRERVAIALFNKGVSSANSTGTRRQLPPMTN